MKRLSFYSLPPKLYLIPFTLGLIAQLPLFKAYAGTVNKPNLYLIEIFQSNPLFVLFAILALGITIGKYEFFGISLGASGVIFASLIAGHLGLEIPKVGKLGLVLFIYCVGLSAGPSFFATFKSQGRTLVKLAFFTLVASGFAAVFCKLFFKLPTELILGLYAGALTSTPGLAAATDALKQPELVAVGYGLAYPFGIMGVILFVQIVPKCFKLIPDPIALNTEDKISRVLIEIKNPQLFGQRIVGRASRPVAQSHFHISRYEREGHLVPITHETTYEPRMIVMAVGSSANIPELELYLGKIIDTCVSEQIASDTERAKLVLTNKEYSGKTLTQLEIFSRYGIIVTRITRLDRTFVPSPEVALESGDTLTCVGSAPGLQNFARLIGHKAKAIHETDILSLLLGILVGLFIGMIPLALPGTPSITLGATGGCLIASILLGHFGRIGIVVSRVPIAARIIMQELGLVLFLAEAGNSAGGSFVAVVKEYGLSVFLAGAIITIIPLLVGYAGGYFCKLTEMQILGALCGSMTSTPALGTLTSKTDSEVPVTSYASSYPLAMVLVIAIVNALATFR